MAAPWEPEETVGELWHRLVGGRASYPAHPEAAVDLRDLHLRLAIVFRALGGGGGVRIAAGGAEASSHRLSLLQRLALGHGEALPRPSFDGIVVQLPHRLDVFADRADNVALYEWLIAFFAHCPPPQPLPSDPLQADLARLRLARRTVAAVLGNWPGLRPVYSHLCAALRPLRPARRLPAQEAAVETLIAGMLGAPVAVDPFIERADLASVRAHPRYRPFLPVPLWGETAPAPAAAASAAREDGAQGAGLDGDERRRKASRRRYDQPRRDDPLMLNRFEKILGLAEMVNVNRKTEDDDADDARKAAAELDQIALGDHQHRPATRLRLDLDLEPADADAAPLVAELTYPEWDWKRKGYRPDHCRVVIEPAPSEGEDWSPDASARRRIALVRRRFEALRPRRRILPAQADGDHLDLSALVRAMADARAGAAGSDRVFSAVRDADRDLCVCVLMDVSMSTDAWIDRRRVLEVEKEALLALTYGLSACGDEHSIVTFTSRRRHRVTLRTVKDFQEPLSAPVVRRIQALKPGDYTRMGAAIRHAARLLEKRPQRQRLLLLLSDGKPNDCDHYEGRYALEDTRVAIHEARRLGLKVFGVTVDDKGRDYLPYLFGPASYAICPHIARLPAVLPAIYRQLTV